MTKPTHWTANQSTYRLGSEQSVFISNPRYSWMSNSAPIPVKYNDIVYPNVDLALLCWKYNFHNEIVSAVLESKDLSDISGKVSKIENRFDLKCCTIRSGAYEFLFTLIRNKVAPLLLYQERLKETVAENYVVYDILNENPSGEDLYWGIKFDTNTNQWFGRNELGNLWAGYRADLLRGEARITYRIAHRR